MEIKLEFGLIVLDFLSYTARYNRSPFEHYPITCQNRKIELSVHIFILGKRRQKLSVLVSKTKSYIYKLKTLKSKMMGQDDSWPTNGQILGFFNTMNGLG